MLLNTQWFRSRESTHWLTSCLREIAFETLNNTVAEVQILAQVDTKADRRAEAEVETLSETETELEANKLPG